MDQKNSKKMDAEQALNEAFFNERLAFNLDLLNYKLSCFYNIDSSDAKRQFEYLTAFDSVITHLRAMFMEKGSKNYTLQNYFIRNGKQDIAQKIDQYLDGPFDAHEPQSIRTALRFISDKFVCHFDRATSIELGKANCIMSILSSPHSFINLKKIVENLTKIITEEQ